MHIDFFSLQNYCFLAWYFSKFLAKKSKCKKIDLLLKALGYDALVFSHMFSQINVCFLLLFALSLSQINACFLSAMPIFSSGILAIPQDLLKMWVDYQVFHTRMILKFDRICCDKSYSGDGVNISLWIFCHNDYIYNGKFFWKLPDWFS